MEKVEELDVFKLSHSLTLEIYRITRSFPEEEKFGLISQMRKAAYSIPMNLMEGGTPFEFKGISSIHWNRQRFCRRNEISIVAGQRFELHF